MNFRQFFTSHTWWGKLIGAFFGYLMAGPIGAIIGILFGNIFDKGLSEYFANPHLNFRTQSHESVQTTFIEATFAFMGYIAKIDGRVSEQEISMANTLMKDMHLNHEQKKIARHFFNQGKHPGFNPTEQLNELIYVSQNNLSLLKTFIDIQYQMAQVDGLTGKKITALNIIFEALGFAPLNRQSRFYQEANARQSSYQYTGGYSHQQNHSSSYRQAHTPYNELDAAYALLQVKPSNTQQEVKKAYQRLISRNHPDKLIAKGMSQEHIKQANEKTQKIRKAYELICTTKGW